MTEDVKSPMAPKSKVRRCRLSTCVLLLVGCTAAIYLTKGLEYFQRFTVSHDKRLATPDETPLVSATTSRSLSLEDRQSELSLSKLTAVENNYESTMRSCLGKMCFDQPVESTELVRVGLLAPPLSGVNVIMDMLVAAGVKNSSKLEVVPDAHVPPYGYGKNHGWSRLVRVVRRLVPHAFALVADKYEPHNDRFKELFRRQIQQLMRWHCRLNHVAAHTSMLTIFLEDLISRPAYSTEEILTYMGYKLSRAELRAASESEQHRAALRAVVMPHRNRAISPGAP